MSSVSTFPPFAASPALDAEADECIAKYPESKRTAVLPLLHIVQKKFGFLSDEAIQWVAAKLELEPIKILEVVTFYPGFRQYSPGKYHVRVCRTLSCAMGGSEELMNKLCEEFGIDRSNVDPQYRPMAVSPCGKYSVEYSECMAACGTAPVCMVNDDFYEKVDVKMIKDACKE